MFSSTANAEFPALSICPDYDQAYKSEALKQFGIIANDVRNFRFSKFNGSESTFNQYEKVTFDIDEVIEDFTITMRQPITDTTHVIVFFVNDTEKWRAKVSNRVKVMKLNGRHTEECA